MSKTQVVRGNDYRVPRKSGREAYYNNLNPLGQSAGVGFRLVHDGIDEHRFRRGRSFTVPGDEAMVGMVLEDFPEFQNARIGIRLTADWSRA